MAAEVSTDVTRSQLLVYGAIALILVGLTQLVGAGLVLICAGVLVVAAVVVQQLRIDSNRLSELTTRLAATHGVVLTACAGAALVVVGVLIRFSPADIGVVLAASGLAAVAAACLYALLGRSSSARHAHNLQPSAGLASNTGPAIATDRLSDDFRHQISIAVFSHAQRASLLTFTVALTFFAVGIGTFVFLAYGIYLQIAPSEQTNQFDRLVQSYVGFLSQNNGGLQVEQLLTVVALQISRVVPILGLIVIGWIGSRLIVNATRLSQRKVLQDTLSELGPLQSTLAGLPPRKPIADAVEQTLKQAKRSFAVRTWLSVVLFGVGIALFVALFVYAWSTDFAGDPFVTATVAGSGIISFVLSMVANRQSEIRNTLDQIADLQLQIADRAQRSEILDLYVAHLVKQGFNGDRLETLRDALNWLDPLNRYTDGTHLTMPDVNGKHADHGVDESDDPEVAHLNVERLS